ncbi:hypothetical protein [Salipiger sp.]|uniref:hypothetical protein n=1 Tax=Salipiger sp. TaxID=2078585 RepID=UPI003A97241A
MTEDLRKRLDTLRAARGFLLPHHGALAAGAPALHEAYLRMYRALTVDERALSPFARECVWLALLVVAEEGIGTHHIDLFLTHGGTEDQAEALIAMAGFCAGFDALAFAERSWSAQLSALDAGGAYLRALGALNADRIPEDLAELCMLCAQAARGASAAVTLHLGRAYARGIPEPQMVEALSYVIWPVGVNRFVEACESWHHLLQGGTVTPSAPFAVWADMPGMGAFDPEAGGAVGGFEAEP